VTTAAGFAGRHPRLSPLMIRVGHYSTPLQLVLYPLVYLLPVLNSAFLFRKDGPTPWWTAVFVAGLVAIVLNLLVSLAALVHDRSLCLLDVQQAPLLDPQGAATRYRRRLRLRHSRRAMVLSLVPMLWVILQPSLGPFLPSWARLALIPVAGAIIAWTIYLSVVCVSTHRRLEPWCPYCHWGDGGDEEVAPQPDPAPSGTVN
jgi:hypothetical protein